MLTTPNAMTVQLRFSFLCGLRGYHEYRMIWTPVLHEVLPAKHEDSNIHDPYAIACTKRMPGHLLPSVVGHLPKEIARIIRFIILHGARVTAKVVDTHHRRSPLVQGGLEIPVEVTIAMDFTSKNEVAIKKCESLVKEKYKEPVQGKFEDVTAAILERLKSDSENSDDSEMEFEDQ